MNRMRKQSGQEGSSAGALHELRGPSEHSKHDAHERRTWQIAGRNMGNEFGATCDGGPIRFLFQLCGNELIESLHISQILLKKRLKLFFGKLIEKCIQTARQCRAGKAGCFGALLKGQLAKFE